MPEAHLNFTVLGPFSLPYDSPGRGRSKRINLDHALEFWALPELDQLRGRFGCYVFALGSGPGFTPWYVGKTTKSFEQEALHYHKLVYYNEVVYRGRKGKPVMFFVPVDEVQGKVPKAEINSVETFLIQSAVFKNPDLKNKLKANLSRWGIKGVIRGGKGNKTTSAKRFKSMMGL
jgi:hypothetical protein